MRTGAFSDDRIVERLRRDFVCVWRNIRPSESYADGLYSDDRPLRLDRGAGANNICGHIATPEGRILHAIQGYVDAKTLHRELEFAACVARLTPEELPAAYRQRVATFKSTADRGDLIMSANLLRLADEPLPSLDTIFRAEEAGLKRNVKELVAGE